MRLLRVPSGSAAAALGRPAAEGGSVVVVADAALRPVQALLRWDPARHAARERADGPTLGVLPATRFALTGTPSALGALLPVRSARLTPLPLDAVPGPGGHPPFWWGSSSVCASKKCAARRKVSGSGVSNTAI